MPNSVVPADPVIVELSTRRLTVALSRPWGPTVTENHLIVVEITDSTGAVGTGFSWTPTIGPAAVQALLDFDIRSFVVGRTAHPVILFDELWAYLHEAGGGGLTTIAMAGVDLALWDLRARVAGVSVPQLIGKRRHRLPAYGSGVNLHYELDELVEQARRWVAQGYAGVKIKVGSPDLDRDLERVAAVRAVLGPKRRLMVDANQRWDLPTALRAADRLRPFDLHWIEEPFRADDTTAHVTFRQRSGIPVAVGENLHTSYRFRDMIIAGGCDVVQPNIIRVGGLTPFLRIADLTTVHSLQLAPHLLCDLSAQIGCVTPQAVWVEEVEDASFADLGLVESPTPVLRTGGEVAVTDRPGLGFDFVATTG